MGSPERPAVAARPRAALFVLRGAGAADLLERARSLRAALESRPGIGMEDLAFTLACEPAAGPETLAIVAAGREDLSEKLGHATVALAKPGVRRIRERSGIYWFAERLAPRGKVAFVFPGEGSQYPGMLAGLCMEFPEARACFDRIDRVFSDHDRGWLPSQLIFPREAGAEDRLFRMDGAVEAVFTANAAIHAVLTKLGVAPGMVVGHSTGDYSALMASGCVPVSDEESLLSLMLDLNGLYRTLEERGEIPESRLVAVGSVEHGTARSFVAGSGEGVSVAMDNCPHQFVLAGPDAALRPVLERLRAEGALLEDLPFSRAYHTPLFEPVCRKLVEFYERLPVTGPAVPVYSAATARPLPAAPAAIRRVSVDQWAMPVRFTETIGAMYEAGARIFVEAGPRGNLTAFVSDILRGRPHLAVPADVRQRGGIDQLLHTLGLLAAHGVPVDLARLHARRAPEHISLEPRAAPAKIARTMTLATGWPEMRLTPRTAESLRSRLTGSTPAGRAAEAAIEGSAAGPTQAGSGPDGAPHDHTGGTGAREVPAPGPSLREQLLASHVRTMEAFLATHEEILRAALAGQGAGLHALEAAHPALQPAAGAVAVAADRATGLVAGGPVSEGLQPATSLRPSFTLDSRHADEGIAGAARGASPQGPPAQGLHAAASAIPPPAGAGTPQATSEEARGIAREITAADHAPSGFPGAETSEAAVREALLALVSDRTGYPAEMIGLDLDLEADLGIDSIKRVEILGSFQKETGLVEANDMDRLSGRKTLRQILDFVAEKRGTATSGSPARPVGPSRSPSSSLVSNGGDSDDPRRSPSIDPSASGEAARTERIHGQPRAGSPDGSRTDSPVSRITAGASSPAPAPAPGDLPFIHEVIVRRPGEEIAAPIVLRVDEARFLKDHCLGRDVSLADRGLTGLPIVPLTMTMEILAEAACALAPGRVVTGMREVRGHRWLTLPEGEIRLLAAARRKPGAGGECVEVRLHAASEAGAEAPGALLAEAEIVLGRSAAAPPEAGPFDLRAARSSRWESERLYRDGMFHGAAFQGVVSMDCWGEDGAEATLRVPAASEHFADRRQPRYVADPVLLDLPGQVVGLWTAEHLDRGYVVFPFRLERLDLFGDRAREGETFSCRARIALEGEGQVRSDLDVVASDGTMRARLVGWWDRRFDLPRPFARLLLSPVDSEVGEPWPLETGGVFNLEDYRGCQIDTAAFPEGLFTSLDGFWAEVLARVVLGSDERRQWGEIALPAPRRLEWLFGRVAAKSAARRLLEERHGLRVRPADVIVTKDESGRPSLSGPWSASIPRPLSVSLSHSGGVAVAVAGIAGGVPESGEGHGIGVDVERLGRTRDEFADAAFTPEEQHLFTGLPDAERAEWALRCWCAKEAVAKALGRGFMGNPRNLVARRLDVTTGGVLVTMSPRMAEAYPSIGGSAIAAVTWRVKDRIYGASTCQRSSE